MNDQMNDSESVDLERSLRALADEDCHLQAPPHVHRAVMHRWDGNRRRHGTRRRVATLLWIGSLAAASVAMVVMYRAPSSPIRPEAVEAGALEQPRAVTHTPTMDRAPRVEPRPRRQPRGRGATNVLADAPAMVLVTDPAWDQSAASIVRVRVPRAALVTLGVPLVEPERGGSVELEMLVGEDGIARTILRAVPVSVDQQSTSRDEE